MSRVGAVLLGVLLVAWIAAWVVPYDVVGDVHAALGSSPPGPGAWLGTDHLGRDVALRLLVATRAFVGPGLVTAALAVGGGGFLGALAGWYGGWVDRIVAAAFTTVSAVPRLVLVLLCCTIFGAGPWILATAAGLACAPEPGQALRGRIDGLKRAEFVTAARAHGVPAARVLWYHLVWVNGRGPLLRQAAQAFAFFLIVETTLSYLGGFGVPEPQPSWGNMLAFEFGVQADNPWAQLAPAAAIWAVALAAAWVASDADREGARG